MTNDDTKSRLISFDSELMLAAFSETETEVASACEEDGDDNVSVGNNNNSKKKKEKFLRKKKGPKDRMSCENCLGRYTTFSRLVLKKHQERCKPRSVSKNDLSCGKCNNVYKLRKSLESHAKTCKGKNLACDVCQGAYKTASEKCLRRHRMSCKGTNNKAISSPQKKKKAEVEDDGKSDSVDRLFEEFGLETSGKVIPRPDIEWGRLWECYACNLRDRQVYEATLFLPGFLSLFQNSSVSVSSSKRRIGCHVLAKHHGFSPFKCDPCGLRFDYRYNFKRHQTLECKVINGGPAEVIDSLEEDDEVDAKRLSKPVPSKSVALEADDDDDDDEDDEDREKYGWMWFRAFRNRRRGPRCSRRATQGGGR